MRILIIGDPKGRDDEGMKRVNAHLKSELQSLGNHCIIAGASNIKVNQATWDKIIFTSGPTQNTLYKVAALRLLHPRSEIVMCGLMPSITAKRSMILSHCVDRMVSENPLMLDMAKLNKIQSVQQTAATFGFEKFLQGRDRCKPKRTDGPLRVLHVGHLNEKRNVYELALLCHKLGYTLTFLVSNTVEKEQGERERLEALGTKIISEYQEDLFEFYRQHDLYAFPVKRADAAISMPLSIIEALLAGINVISTDFGEVSENLGNSNCVEITDNFDTLTATQLEVLASQPVMKIEELQKYDSRQFAHMIAGK